MQFGVCGIAKLIKRNLHNKDYLPEFGMQSKVMLATVFIYFMVFLLVS